MDGYRRVSRAVASAVVNCGKEGSGDKVEVEPLVLTRLVVRCVEGLREKHRCLLNDYITRHVLRNMSFQQIVDDFTDDYIGDIHDEWYDSGVDSDSESGSEGDREADKRHRGSGLHIGRLMVLCATVATLVGRYPHKKTEMRRNLR